MGSTNFGTQSRFTQYSSNVDSNNVNDRVLNTIQRGIYTGGYLTKINDTTVAISALECEIGDANHQTKIQTTIGVNLTVDSSTPWIVLRWAFVASTTNYMDMLAVATVSANDLVIGKCNFTGATLTGFDYSLRSSPNTFDKHLLVEPTETASMYVRIRGGKVSFGTTTFDVIDQLSPIFTTGGLTTGQSRIDLLAISVAGTVTVTAGTPATTGSQVAPTYGTNLVIAEITINYGQTTITSSSIRTVQNAARYAGNAVLLTGDQTVAGIKTFSSFPITPSSNPTTNYQVANKKYVDDNKTVQVGFGIWSSKSADTAYYADTDGIVTCHGRDEGSQFAYIEGYTDSSSNPTTRRIRASGDSGVFGLTFTMPVRKGDYWKVTKNATNSLTTYWLPLGV